MDCISSNSAASWWNGRRFPVLGDQRVGEGRGLRRRSGAWKGGVAAGELGDGEGMGEERKGSWPRQVGLASSSAFISRPTQRQALTKKPVGRGAIRSTRLPRLAAAARLSPARRRRSSLQAHPPRRVRPPKPSSPQHLLPSCRASFQSNPIQQSALLFRVEMWRRQHALVRRISPVKMAARSPAAWAGGGVCYYGSALDGRKGKAAPLQYCTCQLRKRAEGKEEEDICFSSGDPVHSSSRCQSEHQMSSD